MIAIQGAILAAVMTSAVYNDMKSGKIYNKITLPAIGFGIILNAATFGVIGLLSSLAAIGIILIPYLLFGSIAGIGGGDIKLMMAVGAIMGLEFVIWAILISAIIGGIMALAVMIRRKAVMSAVKGMMICLIARMPVSQSGALKFKYSPAIAVGTFIVFAYKVAEIL